MTSDRVLEQRISKLIQVLDGPSQTAADEAHEELSEHASVAVPILRKKLASMTPAGQREAIELIEEAGDHDSCDELVVLLGSDDDMVVYASAQALGTLGCKGAVTALRDAYAHALGKGTPPGWAAPVAIRGALTQLGARTPVVPSRTAELRTSIEPFVAWPEPFVDAWPSEQLVDVIRDLAAHGQVLLYFQVWKSHAGKLYLEESGDWEVDHSQAWMEVVRAAEAGALAAAGPVPPGRYVTIEWISEDDL
jgi:hypothetical protein